MIRYCLTARQKLQPCDVGWGNCGTNGCSSCFAEPQEENCHYLVDEKQPQTCPYCGGILSEHSTSASSKDYGFGQHIKEAVRAIKEVLKLKRKGLAGKLVKSVSGAVKRVKEAFSPKSQIRGFTRAKNKGMKRQGYTFPYPLSRSLTENLLKQQQQASGGTPDWLKVSREKMAVAEDCLSEFHNLCDVIKKEITTIKRIQAGCHAREASYEKSLQEVSGGRN